MRRLLIPALALAAALALLWWACLLATEGRPPGPRWTHPIYFRPPGEPLPPPGLEPPLVTGGADEGRGEPR
jgi:hypothetical protein